MSHILVLYLTLWSPWPTCWRTTR